MPYTNVDFVFLTPTGVPIANALVEIQLVRSSFDDELSGVLMPRLVEVRTNEVGKVLVPLLPSKASYIVTVEDTLSDAVISYEIYVPKVASNIQKVRFQDLVITGPISTKPYDEEALALIQDTKIHVLAALVEAREAAALANQSIATVLQATTDTAANAASALTSSQVATVKASEASVSQIAALASEQAAKIAREAADVASVGASIQQAIATTKASEANVSAEQSNAASVISVAAKVASEGFKVEAQVSATQSNTAKIDAETAKDMAIKTLPVKSATPPTNPLEGAEWINSNTLHRYTWLVKEGVGVWAEIGPVLVIDSGNGSGSFDLTELERVTNLDIENASLVLENSNTGQIISLANATTTSFELPTATTLSANDFIVVTQDGIDKRVSMSTLAAYFNNIN